MIFIKKNTVMLTSHKILLMFQGKTYIFLMLPTMKAKSVLTMNCFDSEMILCKVSIA